MKASTPIIQNGITDTSTAVTPLGTNCCAHTRQPLPKPIINKPSSACPPHGSRGGSLMPRILRISARPIPAMTWRGPAIANGGMLSIATRVARYVVPHEMHTAIQAQYARRSCLGEESEAAINVRTIQGKLGSGAIFGGLRRKPHPTPISQGFEAGGAVKSAGGGGLKSAGGGGLKSAGGGGLKSAGDGGGKLGGNGGFATGGMTGTCPGAVNTGGLKPSSTYVVAGTGRARNDPARNRNCASAARA